MKIKILSILSIFWIMNDLTAQISYPVTTKQNVLENYHGTQVADPYRWLEDDNSDATKSWVKSQNIVTFDYLEKIPFRNKIRARLESLWNYPKYSAPFKEGNYYYFYKNDGLQNQSVLYRQDGLDAAPDVFIDPNKLSSEGTVALGNVSFSKNSTYCVYTVSKAGSDWSEAYIMDVASKTLIKDKLEWLKFSSLSWIDDDGFFYSRYPEPDEKTRLSGQNKFHMVYYHKLGTSQADDIHIFSDESNPLHYHFASVTEDQQYLIIAKSKGTSGVALMARKISDGLDAPLRWLFSGYDYEASVINSDGDRILVQTNKGAPNYKVVGISYSNALESNWTNIIPEQKEVLESVGTSGGYLYAGYLKDASSLVIQYDIQGKKNKGYSITWHRQCRRFFR